MLAGREGELRIGLTISGAIALGAFEAGALAALLVGVQAVNATPDGQDTLRVDVIAGASAGSMTGLLAARILLAGLDPIETMHSAWVRMPQLDDLADHMKAPLAVDRMEAMAKELLLDTPGSDTHQKHAITIHMALGSLHRLDYEIGRVGGAAVLAGSYLDWDELELRPTTERSVYEKAIVGALASGAHALAFRPRKLDRTDPMVVKRYRANHVDNPPTQAWYTDGGTIDNQPLGRALDLSQKLDLGDEELGDASRLHLMIVPDPPVPTPDADRWTAEAEPRWTTTGAHVLTLLRSQHLYDDLYRLENTNNRIRWTQMVIRKVAAILAAPEPRKAAAAMLAEVIDDITAEQLSLFDPAPAPDLGVAPNLDPDFTELLRDAIELATGFGQKSEIKVAVVSPLALPEDVAAGRAPRELLSGAFLGHFGGFLSPELRENDFALGYQSMCAWMRGPDGLERSGLAAERAATAADAADKHVPAWNSDLGGMTLDKRPRHERHEIVEIAFRAGLIAGSDVRHDGLGHGPS
jgi:predicted acylesterase/phospholipase RssA